MLAHTHGQPATPTTVGKEFANVVHRLRQQLQCVREAPLLGKIAGATGSYQAHLAACPDADWPAFAEKFVSSLGLKWNKYTAQIDPAPTPSPTLHRPPHANQVHDADRAARLHRGALPRGLPVQHGAARPVP